ncbi:MAG: acyltransferase [Chlorobium sp.]|nr:acyltransferase [Chlorobium sp.]
MSTEESCLKMKRRMFYLINKDWKLRTSLRRWYHKFFFREFGAESTIETMNILQNPHRISIGSGVRIEKEARLEAILNFNNKEYNGEIFIGDNASIQPYLHIGAATTLRIGKNVLMASHVYITDHDHVFLDSDLHVGLQPLDVATVEIGDYVWLGENVVVLKGVTIGNNAIIGANSVVTKNIPPFAIAAGSPARVIRIRS